MVLVVRLGEKIQFEFEQKNIFSLPKDMKKNLL